MHEARIILPKQDTDGSSLSDLKACVSSILLANFGGYTLSAGFGGWTADDGEIVEEEVWIFDVAGDDTPVNDHTLLDLALVIFAESQQQAVYVRKFNGTVAIIDRATVKAQEASHV